MESDAASRQDITTSEPEEASNKAQSEFQWQSSDAAFLQPSILHIPRIQRAWDRTPASPFSRQRVRVGKVWKRGADQQRGATTVSTTMGSSDERKLVESLRATKRVRTTTLRLQSPLRKPVKKMCFDAGFGLGARVRQWEVNESPVRKIITRSNTSEEEMLALDEGEEDRSSVRDEGDEEGDVTIEIIKDDGTIEQADICDVENAEWEDEREDQLEGLSPNAETDDDVSTTQERIPLLGASEEDITSIRGSDDNTMDEANTTEQTLSIEMGRIPQDETDSRESDLSQGNIQHVEAEVIPQNLASIPLPDGFVSPMKSQPRTTRRLMRESIKSRRRTLPIQFAPVFEPRVNTDADYENVESLADNQVEFGELAGDIATLETEEQAEALLEFNETEAHELPAESLPEEELIHELSEEEWEDVDSDTDEDDLVEDVELAGAAISTAESPGKSVNDATGESILGPNQDSTALPDDDSDSPVHGLSLIQEAFLLSPKHMPSSPIPTIESQHPRLPLRRSPRRRSTSPLKPSITLSSNGPSHLIAFTPIKRSLLPWSDDQQEVNESAPTRTLSPQSIPPERASSAPPEVQEVTPRRTGKPRISDDTALLQAFLSRAAESRSERRASVTRRESISNQKDSDAVRQALSSPTRLDVLGDLDPNSPIPRKTPTSTEVHVSLQTPASATPDEVDTRDLSDDGMAPKVRRSGRASRKRADVPAPSTPGPNRISIRGNADAVILKRSEAQETALLTRTNTKRNKFGAIMPLQRLAKLNLEPHIPVEDSVVDDPFINIAKDGTRKVTWAETLVEFNTSGEISETSFTSDSVDVPIDGPTRGESRSAQTSAPLASDTPSKPKVRRLKPAKPTASTPAPSRIEKSAHDSAAPETIYTPAMLPEPTPAARPTTKRRSRIATPAKGLSAGSLLPADVINVASTMEAQAPPTKKKVVSLSKLPAPSTSSVSQGKENLISSSPKKKAPVPTLKSVTPRFDFSVTKTRSDTFQAGSTTTTATGAAVTPGLMSPAKKAGGRAVFSHHPKAGEEVQMGRNDELPSLSSPAKKRTRRVDL